METLLMSARVMEFSADTKLSLVQWVKKGQPVFVSKGTVISGGRTPLNITLNPKPLKPTLSHIF